MVKARINEIDCMLFYDERITPENAPFGYPHMYHLRHDEDDWTCPISIERFVAVNFFGTVFMKEPIEIERGGYTQVRHFCLEADYAIFRIGGALFEKIFCP